MNLTVKKLPLAQLSRDPKNARLHPDRNLEAIRASLMEFGQVEPLVVRKKTKQVIGGNGRLEVMEALGWKTADVVMLDISEEKAAALGIVLNRSVELAKWDDDKLAATLSSLNEGGVDLACTGFDAASLNKMLAKTPDLEKFVKDEPIAQPKAPTGDGSWFYIEYYGEDDRFELLKELLGPAMRGAHEIEPDEFEKMIRLWAESKK
jgi:ParB-like chromosome segregation protein Spo0J